MPTVAQDFPVQNRDDLRVSALWNPWRFRPTTTKRELAHSSSSRLEAAPSSAVGLFDEVNELLAQGTVLPAAVQGRGSMAWIALLPLSLTSGKTRWAEVSTTGNA